MSASLSRYLKDFSAPKAPLSLMPPKYFPDIDGAFPERGGFAVPPVPSIDVEAERREAFEQGREEAEAELQFEHRNEISELKALHAAELEAMRIRCDNEIAAMIFDRFTDMADRLALTLGDQTARVLAPVMDTVLQRKSIEDMARMISLALTAGEACTIIVKGPLPLFEALKRHLDDDALVFRHHEAADIDLSVEFGDAILVTRMAAWADTVRKVLA